MTTKAPATPTAPSSTGSRTCRPLMPHWEVFVDGVKLEHEVLAPSRDEARQTAADIEEVSEDRVGVRYVGNR